MFIVIKRNEIRTPLGVPCSMNALGNIDDFPLIVELEHILFFKIDFEFL